MDGLLAPLRPWAFKNLKPHHYNLMAADPPWAFETYSEKGIAKGAAAHYRCYSVEDIVEMFPMGQLADPNSLFLCWGTAPLIDRQIAAVKAWGFEFKTLAFWHKVFPSGKTAMGPGYRARTMAEPLIIATRGEPVHKPLPGLFQGIRREHSRKPESFYQIVDACCPRLRRRADVFSRQVRDGWEAFGDEVGKFEGAVA